MFKFSLYIGNLSTLKPRYIFLFLDHFSSYLYSSSLFFKDFSFCTSSFITFVNFFIFFDNFSLNDRFFFSWIRIFSNLLSSFFFFNNFLPILKFFILNNISNMVFSFCFFRFFFCLMSSSVFLFYKF